MEKVTLKSGKVAFAADAYQPNPSMFARFVGRQRELKMITAAWLRGRVLPPMSPLLVGEPGVGKNRLVYEMSRQTGSPLYIFQGHEEVTAEDLACSVRFSDEDGKHMDYVLSPLVTAMLNGGICFIDEIGKIRPRALALLVSVLDERRYIDSNLLGERIHAKPGFRIIAATNSGEVNSLPEFIQSRMRPLIDVGHPAKEEIDEIITRHIPSEQEVEALLKSFWKLWNKSKRSPSPRDALHHFALASSLSDIEGSFDKNRSNGGDQSVLNLQVAEDSRLNLRTEHLKEAFLQLNQEDSQ